MSKELQRLVANLSPDKRAYLARLLGPEREPIAIVGAACRFPGAKNTAEFWRLMIDGRCTTSLPPPDRDLDLDALYDPTPGTPGRLYARHGGYLEGVDLFDADFFGIRRREAEAMDPQQRLLLEVAWEAMEDAGLVPQEIRGSNTGVFVGICSDDYIVRQLRSGDPRRIDMYCLPGCIPSVASGRLSYVFDFQGPNVPFDTACSSSLVAAHYAVQSLRNRECNVALAGGVNLVLSPEGTIYFSTAGLLAKDGRVKAFDAGGDGFVRAEGCGVVVLKRLSDALAAGDPVHAVIRGTAVNHNGHGNGLTAPSVIAQRDLMRAALADAAVSPDRVGFVEAHGTGTEMGDAIEIDAIKEAYGEGRAPEAGPCFIGSAKTNVGHMEAAAGIGGLIKTALVLATETIPPNLHYHAPNPHLSLDGTPFVFPLELERRPAAATLAAVSSFGFGGTNAHMILEAAPAPAARPEAIERAAHLLVLSAKNQEALLALAASYASALEGEAPALGDFCYTAAVRRTHHPHRLAIVARDRREMIERLAEFCAGTSSAAVCFGEAAAESAPEDLPAPARDEKDRLLELARRFVLGAPIDLRALYPTGRAVRLPAYPFQRRRFWVPRPDRQAPASNAAASEHPTLRLLGEERGVIAFEALLAGDGYLDDHRVDGLLVVPGAWYLELALSVAQVLGKPAVLEEVELEHAMVLPDAGQRTVRVEVGGDQFWISSRGPGEAAIEHVRGRFAASVAPAPPQLEPGVLRRTCTDPIADPYAPFERHSIHFGPSFRRLSAVARNGEEWIASLGAREGDRAEGSTIHPAVLDGALQVWAVALLAADSGGRSPIVPVRVERVAWHAELHGEGFVHARKQSSVSGDVTLADAAGRVIVELTGVGAKSLDGALASREAIEAGVIEIWRDVLKEPVTTESFCELGGDSKLAAMVTARVWKRWNVKLEVRSLLEADSVQAYAAEVAHTLGAPAQENSR